MLFVYMSFLPVLIQFLFTWNKVITRKSMTIKTWWGMCKNASIRPSLLIFIDMYIITFIIKEIIHMFVVNFEIVGLYWKSEMIIVMMDTCPSNMISANKIMIFSFSNSAIFATKCSFFKLLLASFCNLLCCSLQSFPWWQPHAWCLSQ